MTAGLVGRVRSCSGQHSAAYYRDQIPVRRTVMAVSVTVPALAALVAGYSVFARPRNVLRASSGLLSS
ncbi:hypothetical protein [Paenarthrobacter nitroguajacolicus]|uniref:hypothetical protein n=1 Tax=Paenarthrobacter nitroguajacolicus TaxID=211146 RepID=UPI001FCA91B4|nr:hypothetical protein [Paenarthrobacter nitroguajacolicus]